MSAKASGARYSLIPRLPTATPLRTEIYTGAAFDALPPLSLRNRGCPGELLTQSDVTIARCNS
jgi:hypothetical protein